MEYTSEIERIIHSNNHASCNELYQDEKLALATFEIGPKVNSSMVASFDMDFTILKPKEGRTFPKDGNDWEWLNSNVPTVLKSLHEKGYKIVVFTN